MLKVSAAEFQRNIGRYQDVALREPVAVTSNGRDSCVLISSDEYDRLKRRDRQVFATDEAPQGILDAVGRSEMDERHRPLDDLLADWTP